MHVLRNNVRALRHILWRFFVILHSCGSLKFGRNGQSYFSSPLPLLWECRRRLRAGKRKQGRSWTFCPILSRFLHSRRSVNFVNEYTKSTMARGKAKKHMCFAACAKKFTKSDERGWRFWPVLSSRRSRWFRCSDLRSVSRPLFFNILLRFA